MRKKLIIILYLLVLTVIFGLVFIKPAFKYLSSYLSESRLVKANILIVEGWLPDYAFEMAYKEFQENKYDHIVTTGLLSTPEYFNVYSNGYLVFNTYGKHTTDTESSLHTIEINAYSSLDGINSAHFKLLINDSTINDFSANKRKKNYQVRWNGQLSEIDSISVKFDNDQINETGDRNLFIKEVILDHRITIPYQLNSSYIIPGNAGNLKLMNDYSSYAEHARNSLIAMGIDSSIITQTPAKKVILNRTLSSALAFSDWLKTSKNTVNGINIITLGTHAKRTWMTYNKVLNEEYQIGIISLPDYMENNSRKYKMFKTIRETFGIVYYWFVLIPF